ncbi:tRNA pseudouridine(55) synthase TruB [Luteimonas sp. FXH3W]|uniref:tRNA pseudouridine synthase B n=1 Tax=Aquilutibacter rugosus TaxID=3115820 RepID=A0ABU7V018_9GAMM
MGHEKRPRVTLRPLHGIVLLDKASGPSSNTALQQVRFAVRAEKGGHTGALDPLASGMLPLCFGEASKVAGYLLGNNKTYEVTAKLGQVTDTDDSEGEVIRERPVVPSDRATLERLCLNLTGEIEQRAPIYSALKQGGEPLYAKARRGESVEAPVRTVQVHDIEILELTDAGFRLRVSCGSGTYIRSIVRDLGEELGCGAHVTQLRRLHVEPFEQRRMWTLEEIRELAEADRLEEILLPIEEALPAEQWPRLKLNGQQVEALSHGKRITPELGATQAAGPHLALAVDGTAVGLVEVREDGTVAAKRLFSWVSRSDLHQ